MVLLPLSRAIVVLLLTLAVTLACLELEAVGWILPPMATTTPPF
jgi:hypothetical protein